MEDDFLSVLVDVIQQELEAGECFAFPVSDEIVAEKSLKMYENVLLFSVKNVVFL